MAQVRVVGGHHDGESVDSSMVDGHTHVQMTRFRSLPVGIGEPMSNVAGTVEYTVRRLRFAYHDMKGKPVFEEIVFLAEANMTDIQAMRHIFETWGPV